jgi:hypothetical protein
VIKIRRQNPDPTVLEFLEFAGSILKDAISLIDPKLIGLTDVIGRSAPIELA